jgi:hypothetical protein
VHSKGRNADVLSIVMVLGAERREMPPKDRESVMPRPFVSCPKCFSPIAIRLWHEPEDDHEVVLWQCSACTHQFETQEDPTSAATELKEVVRAFWPTVLMA